MKDILEDIDKKEIVNKNKKYAFITLFVVLILLLVKFFVFFNTTNYFDSPLLPKYTVLFNLQDTFLLGIIMNFGVTVSFILYNYKKYSTAFIINSLLIVINFIFPYFYYTSA